MGDINVKVGSGQQGMAVGPFGLGDRDARSDAFVEWCGHKENVV